MNELAQKVALITGSSRGIGAAVARLFAERGAKVVLHGRDENALRAVQADIEGRGGTVMHYTANATSFVELEAMRHAVESSFGPIDVLIANAGGNQTRPNQALEEISEEGFRVSIEGNLTATFLAMKSVLPGMKERKRGSIVTVSSAASRRVHPASPIPYAVAKAGIELMTQQVAAQAGPFGVRVNCIAPETILTENNQVRIPDEQKASLAAIHPLQRLGTPEDVARAALFLASEGASWITGVVLDVAGGAVLVR